MDLALSRVKGVKGTKVDKHKQNENAVCTHKPLASIQLQILISHPHTFFMTEKAVINTSTEFIFGDHVICNSPSNHSTRRNLMLIIGPSECLNK